MRNLSRFIIRFDNNRFFKSKLNSASPDCFLGTLAIGYPDVNLNKILEISYPLSNHNVQSQRSK
jgi:hypothetical protein